MARLSWIQNTIGQLRTVTILYTFVFVITRHTCHRCVYLMVIVIFSVVACTITFLIKTYFLLPFLIILWWLWTFCDHVIFRSTSKAFQSRTFRLSIVLNINRKSFFVFLSDPFETFFWKVICTSTKCALFLNSICSLNIPTKTWSAAKIKVISL